MNIERKYKKVVSVSLGSSKRNHETVIQLFNKDIEISRIGTDGDLNKARDIFRTLDGKVDVFGLGGTDLGLMVDKKWFPIHSILNITKDIGKTPLVDGTGLKTMLEKKVAGVLIQYLAENQFVHNKKVLIMNGCDRWGLQHSFLENGFENTYGDLIFGLGIPFSLNSERQVKNFARILAPFVLRLPFRWLYPLGENQLVNTPKASGMFAAAAIIAGDRHYIMKYMPHRLDGKIIVTNTTTKEDIHIFANAGVYGVLTTTPIFEGRSFGTNVIEAAIIAAKGYNSKIDYSSPNEYFKFLEKSLNETSIKPEFIVLNK